MSETDWLTRTRWIVYGAASSFLEALQDQEKAQANWEKYAPKITDMAAWDSLASELASKGAMTEEEARRYVEERLAGKPPADPPPPPPSGPITIDIEDVTDAAADPGIPPSPPPSADSTPVSADDIAELMDLTRQIETLRLDLEKRRVDGDPR